MTEQQDAAVVVKSVKEMGCLSWVIHSLAFGIGMVVLWIAIGDVLNVDSDTVSTSKMPTGPILLMGGIFVIWGLSPFLHFRLILFSFSLLFFVHGWIGLIEGEIKACARCRTYYRESDPDVFYFWIAVLFAVAIAGAIWAWTVKPSSPNKALNADP